MNLTILFPIAGLLTLGAAALLWLGVRQRDITTMQQRKPGVGALVTASILLTLLALVRLNPVTEHGINFTLAAGTASATLLIQLIYLYGIVRHGVQGLGLFILPVTALPLMILPALPEASTPNWVETSSILEDTHLLTSLVAYAVLTLAAVHALMYLMLDRALKRKRLSFLMQALPPLFDIDRYMFAQVRGATTLIGISILSGLSWQWMAYGTFILWNHKVLLALFAFGILVLLLVKRQKNEWPGRTSSRVILAAYVLMLLAYFGVKLITAWLH
ncbi:MAG: hypothetical protein D6678_04920 [Zetaproteobacteria bacterium]|nr:MAG: hypothetical protein D6678_04920 [Zetaproteobacteria bacterium]